MSQFSIFSKALKGKGKMFFFDLKEAKSGKGKYVQVTESRMKDGQAVKNRIFLFPDQIADFCQVLTEVQAKV